jgi:hypothetical protein
MSVVVALGTGLAAWWLHTARWRPVAVVFIIATLALTLGAALKLALYPWTDLAVACVALAGGMLLGRAIPARAAPMFILLGLLAVLDTIQVLISGPGPSPGGAARPALFFYGMLVIGTPLPHVEVGVFDLLLIAAMAEHGRSRRLPLVAAVAPGVIGFVLADAAILVVGPTNLPLVPFLVAGWLLSEAGWRLLRRASRRGIDTRRT